jgi:large subunit ribosomal protein L2
MGKQIISQKRGKGGPTYRVPNYHFQPKLEYKNMPGYVVDIVNARPRFVPLAEIKWADGSKSWIPSPEGIKVGDRIEQKLKRLGEIDVGTQIFAIETTPNSGPKLCRTSPALLFSKDETCIVALPSKKQKILDPNCRALIGIPAGDGRVDKPWAKAGKKWHAMRAKGKLYPRTSANRMGVVSHPFGGTTGKGRPKTVSRHAPPGAKVGSISSRRTGRRK